MASSVLKIDNLRKTYNRGNIWAVDGVSFQVNEKEIVGIIGKNGAGKSTILKSITGVIPFEEGNIYIAGFDVKTDAINAKKQLGYVPDVCNVFDKMTGLEYFNFVADIFNVSKAEREAKLSEFQNVFELGDSIHKAISSYSHGMKQKISIMASLVGSPKLWILDEPTTGLDAQTCANLLNFMQDYAKKGNAVLFSSHNLSNVQKICNRVIVINNGKKIADDKMDRLKKSKVFTLENYFTEIVKEWKCLGPC